MTVRGTARGRVIELDEALPFPSGQKLSIQVQPLEAGAPPALPARIHTPRLANPHDAEDFRKQIVR